MARCWPQAAPSADLTEVWSARWHPGGRQTLHCGPAGARSGAAHLEVEAGVTGDEKAEALVQSDGTALLLDVQRDGPTHTVGVRKHATQQAGADPLTAKLRQQGHIEHLDLLARLVDDQPTGRGIVHDDDLANGTRVLEPDRHHLGPELHPHQPVEHLRAEWPEVVAGRGVEEVLETDVPGQCWTKRERERGGHRPTSPPECSTLQKSDTFDPRTHLVGRTGCARKSAFNHPQCQWVRGRSFDPFCASTLG